MYQVISSVAEQHLDDAGFLWELRDGAVKSPSFRLDDVASLDMRLLAHLEGLKIAFGSDSAILCPAREVELVGVAFVYACHRLEKLAAVDGFQTFLKGREYRRAVVSALGWQGKRLSAAQFPGLRKDVVAYLQCASDAVNRFPSNSAALDDKSQLPQYLISRYVRKIGECGEVDCAGVLRQHFGSVIHEHRFWSAWSLAMLCDCSVGEALKSFVDFKTKFACRAVWLAPRILPSDNCQHWLRELAQEEDLRRFALIGCGVNGDPIYIPTLIHQMSIPEYARVAGEAFSMITGVDLAYEDLDMDQSEDFDAGPTEDPSDDNVDLDPDEDLPWPNPELVDRWWHEHKSEYQPGIRYLCGQPISEANCQRVLREGYQRQRISAAYELALMKPDEPLFEWRAPGWRQQEWLGLRRPRRVASGARARN